MDLQDVRHGRTRHEAENIRENLKMLTQHDDNALVELFREFRVDCHSLGKELMTRDSHAKAEKLEQFFEDVLSPDGEIEASL
jgi:hypothetical protein